VAQTDSDLKMVA